MPGGSSAGIGSWNWLLDCSAAIIMVAISMPFSRMRTCASAGVGPVSVTVMSTALPEEAGLGTASIVATRRSRALASVA